MTTNRELHRRYGFRLTPFEHEDIIEESIPPSLLLKSLVELLRNDKTHCKMCGGLLPELFFFDGSKEYRFVLYEILEDGKTIDKTDYRQLHRYLSAKFQKGVLAE